MWSLVTLGSLRLADVRTGDDCLRGRRKESDVELDAMGCPSLLYSCYILGTHAAAEGRREDAIALYERALNLKLTGELESDIVEHHLRALTEGSGGAAG